MMHTNEIYIDLELAKNLIQNQFPNWATLPLSAISSNGTDNVIYRLGEDLAIRLPSTASSAENIAKEFLWLPKLANFISSPIPEPVALGQPQEHYPYHWLIFKWQVGQNGVQANFYLNQAAEFLGKFVNEMHSADITDAPFASRGQPLSVMQNAVQNALPQISNFIVINKAQTIWQSCLTAPIYTGKPVWTHSDLHAAIF